MAPADIKSIKTVGGHPVNGMCPRLKLGRRGCHLRVGAIMRRHVLLSTTRQRSMPRSTIMRPSTRLAFRVPGERWLYCYPDDLFVEY